MAIDNQLSFLCTVGQINQQGRKHDNPVAGGWAGAVLSWAGAVLSWAGAVLSWAGAVMSWAGTELIWVGVFTSMKYSYLNFSTFKLLNNAKKSKE